jgi:CRISPR system Cascade subunit CasD
MKTLVLRLAGPLQSWGYRSRFSDRDTGLEPTKSGVVGLFCCALGRDRSESPADLSALRMHVRVERSGTLLKDFHTAGGGVFRGSRAYFAPTSSGAKGKNPVVTERMYLADAAFLVALDGDDALVETLAARVQDPVWPLALGRRSCAPSEPVFEALYDGEAPSVLEDCPWRVPQRYVPRVWDNATNRSQLDLSPKKLRLLLECERGSFDGDARRDVPVAWPDRLTREYAVRFVREDEVEKIPEVLP